MRPSSPRPRVARRSRMNCGFSRMSLMSSMAGLSHRPSVEETTIRSLPEAADLLPKFRIPRKVRFLRRRIGPSLVIFFTLSALHNGRLTFAGALGISRGGGFGIFFEFGKLGLQVLDFRI